MLKVLRLVYIYTCAPEADYEKRLLLRPSLSDTAITDVGAGSIADALKQNKILMRLWYYTVLVRSFLMVQA